MHYEESDYCKCLCLEGLYAGPPRRPWYLEQVYEGNGHSTTIRPHTERAPYTKCHPESLWLAHTSAVTCPSPSSR